MVKCGVLSVGVFDYILVAVFDDDDDDDVICICVFD